jgi:hypothetical protein
MIIIMIMIPSLNIFLRSNTETQRMLSPTAWELMDLEGVSLCIQEEATVTVSGNH